MIRPRVTTLHLVRTRMDTLRQIDKIRPPRVPECRGKCLHVIRSDLRPNLVASSRGLQLALEVTGMIQSIVVLVHRFRHYAMKVSMYAYVFYDYF